MPMFADVVEVLLRRQHVAHSAGSERRQLTRMECRVRSFKNLLFCLAGENQLRLHQVDRHEGLRGRRIEAYGSANIGIPELRLGGGRAPAALDDAEEAIGSLCCCRVAVARQHHDFGFVSDHRRSRGASERNLGALVSDQVAIEGAPWMDTCWLAFAREQ